MLFEILLVITAATVGFNIYRTKDIQTKNKLLIGENASLSEVLMLPENFNEAYILHKWEYVSQETVYASIFSMESVHNKTEKCKQCGLIHRYIIRGHTLASKKGLTSLEGYYINGIRSADNGCRSK